MIVTSGIWDALEATDVISTNSAASSSLPLSSLDAFGCFLFLLISLIQIKCI